MICFKKVDVCEFLFDVQLYIKLDIHLDICFIFLNLLKSVLKINFKWALDDTKGNLNVNRWNENQQLNIQYQKIVIKNW